MLYFLDIYEMVLIVILYIVIVLYYYIFLLCFKMLIYEVFNVNVILD